MHLPPAYLRDLQQHVAVEHLDLNTLTSAHQRQFQDEQLVLFPRFWLSEHPESSDEPYQLA